MNLYSGINQLDEKMKPEIQPLNLVQNKVINVTAFIRNP